MNSCSVRRLIYSFSLQPRYYWHSSTRILYLYPVKYNIYILFDIIKTSYALVCYISCVEAVVITPLFTTTPWILLRRAVPRRCYIAATSSACLT